MFFKTKIKINKKNKKTRKHITIRNCFPFFVFKNKK